MSLHSLPAAHTTHPKSVDHGRSRAATRRGLALLLLLLLANLPIDRVNAGIKDSPLNRLALSLVDAPPALRADLAQSALLELSADYAREARHARDDLRREPNNPDLRRWANAIDKLASEQASLAASINATTPVDIGIGPDHDLHITISGNPIVVAGPRPREQAALEQRILERYCNLNLCDATSIAAVSAAASTAPSAGPMLPSTNADNVTVTTHWSFSPAGPSCATEDGLEFQFSGVEALQQKRRLCAAIASELNRLAEALSRQAAAGIVIDWNALRIHAVQDSALQRVDLNRGNATLDLPLQNLVALPELFEMVRPWLAGKVRHEPYHLVVINADRLMAALLPSGD